jgi:hypothetical protein
MNASQDALADRIAQEAKRGHSESDSGVTCSTFAKKPLILLATSVNYLSFLCYYDGILSGP